VSKSKTLRGSREGKHVNMIACSEQSTLHSLRECKLFDQSVERVNSLLLLLRDGHETSMAETETLASRDRDETETLASPAETRPRRDVCRSRDVTETLKYTLSLMQ